MFRDIKRGSKFQKVRRPSWPQFHQVYFIALCNTCQQKDTKKTDELFLFNWFSVGRQPFVSTENGTLAIGRVNEEKEKVQWSLLIPTAWGLNVRILEPLYADDGRGVLCHSNPFLLMYLSRKIRIIYVYSTFRHVFCDNITNFHELRCRKNCLSCLIMGMMSS